MKKVLPPWMLTQKEYEEIFKILEKQEKMSEREAKILKFYFDHFFLTGMTNHKDWVREALIKGEVVPKKTLKEYPDLKIEKIPDAIIWPEYNLIPDFTEISIWLKNTIERQPGFISILTKALEEAANKIPDIKFSRIYVYITEKPYLEYLPLQLNPSKEIQPYLLTTRKAIKELIPKLKEYEKKLTEEIIEKTGFDPFKVLKETSKEFNKKYN